jgi:hypothetical protein
VARATPDLAGAALRRARASLASVAGGAKPFDVDSARAKLAAAFEPA